MKRTLATTGLVVSAILLACCVAGCDDGSGKTQAVTPRKPGAGYDGPPIEAPKPPNMAGAVDDPTRK